LLGWFGDGFDHRGTCVMSYCLAARRRWRGRAERLAVRKQV
jgi:hypothetical protein